MEGRLLVTEQSVAFPHLCPYPFILIPKMGERIQRINYSLWHGKTDLVSATSEPNDLWLYRLKFFWGMLLIDLYNFYKTSHAIAMQDPMNVLDCDIAKPGAKKWQDWESEPLVMSGSRCPWHQHGKEWSDQEGWTVIGNIDPLKGIQHWELFHIFFII